MHDFRGILPTCIISALVLGMSADDAHARIAYLKVRRDHFIGNEKRLLESGTPEMEAKELLEIGVNPTSEKPDAVVVLDEEQEFKVYDFCLKEGDTSVMFKRKRKAEIEITGLSEEMIFLARYVRLLTHEGDWKSGADTYLQLGPKGADYLYRFMEMDVESEAGAISPLPGEKDEFLRRGWRPDEFKRFAFLCTQKLERLAALPETLPEATRERLEKLGERIETTDYIAMKIEPLIAFINKLRGDRETTKIGLYLSRQVTLQEAVRIMDALLGVEISIAVRLEGPRISEERLVFWKAPFHIVEARGYDMYGTPPYITSWNPQLRKTKYYVGQVLCNYSERGIIRAARKIISNGLPVAERVRIDIPDEAGVGEMILLGVFLSNRGAKKVVMKRGK